MSTHDPDNSLELVESVYEPGVSSYLVTGLMDGAGDVTYWSWNPEHRATYIDRYSAPAHEDVGPIPPAIQRIIDRRIHWKDTP